jgi:L-asparagine oxygenase
MSLNIIKLTPAEQKTLSEGLDGIEGSPYGSRFDRFYERVQTRQLSLPVRLRSVIASFKAHSGRSGVLLIRAIPIGAVNKTTPTIAYESVSDKVLGTEKYLLSIAGMIGPPIGFEDWHKGERIQNLYPIPELKARQCASNSVYLEMHTETAFRPTTPTHLALLCLKQDPQGLARTVFCDLGAIIDSMDRNARSILASARFCFQADIDGTRGFTEPKPIDSFDGGKRRLHYAEALTAIDSSGLRALSDLREQIISNSVVLELKKGDLVLIDNYHVIHGRTAFSPRYDGTDRWLQRVLIGKCERAASLARPRLDHLANKERLYPQPS